MGISYLSKMCFELRRFIVIWLTLTAMFGCLSESKCEFKAMFNFGDSNTDTGGFWAAFPAQSGPFGMTHFKKPAGRASDGRLIVDFLAQALGIPFLSPYLQSIGSDFRHGANYATLASTALLPNTSLFVTGISPFSLAIQINQMKEFKAKVDENYAGKDKKLPWPDIFGKSLYTFYIGQNDFTSRLEVIGTEEGKQYHLQVIYTIEWAIKELYALGGRAFMVLNMAPVGCYPSFLAGQIHNTSNLDKFGCVISYNEAAINYNAMLKDVLNQTRASLPADASVIYADTHAVLLDLFRHPKSHGLKYGPRACCGHGGGALNFNPQLYCGNTRVIDGKNLTATACKDPNHYVSFDGIHATEAANKRITKAILKGSYLDPPFPLHKLCNLKPIR